MDKYIEWLKRNESIIKLNKIAAKVGMPHKTLSGFIRGQTATNGYPFVLPDKYKAKLIETIKQIQQLTTIPNKKLKK